MSLRVGPDTPAPVVEGTGWPGGAGQAYRWAAVVTAVAVVGLALPQPVRGLVGIVSGVGGPTWALGRLARVLGAKDLTAWVVGLVLTLASWSLLVFVFVADGVDVVLVAGLATFAILLWAPLLLVDRLERRDALALLDRQGGVAPAPSGWRLESAPSTVDAPPAASAPAPPVAAAVRSDRTFRPDVEGLRAVAVILVVLYHAGIGRVSGGFVGVDVFFVLSGYLITRLLLREDLQRPISFIRGFYARRVRRILPAATVALLVTAMASMAILGVLQGKRVANDARWAALFAGNFHFALQGTNYLQAQLEPSPLQHFWSLAVEEQFYLVWPALILLVARLGRRATMRRRLGFVLIAGILASLTWCIVETTSNPSWAYFSPLTRAWELGLGALIALGTPLLLRLPRLVGQAAAMIGFAAVFVSAFVFTASTSFPGYAATLPVVGTAFVVAGGVVAPAGVLEQWLLRWGPVQWFGKLSYSLYLWHYPVLIIPAERAGHALSTETNVLLCEVALGLAWLSLRLIEGPFRLNRPLLRSPALTLRVGAVLLVVGLTVPSVMIASRSATVLPRGPVPSSALPSRAQILAEVAAAVTLKAVPAALTPAVQQIANDTPAGTVGKCDALFAASSVGPCVFGDPSGRRTIVLTGDSHAAMWFPALDGIANSEHWKLVLLSKASCPAQIVTVWDPVAARPFTECDQFHRFVIGRIRALHPYMVVATGADPPGLSVDVHGHPSAAATESNWEEGDVALMAELRATGTRVAVVGDIPYLSHDGAVCLAGHLGDIGPCDTARGVAVNSIHDAREAAIVVEHGGTYVNVVPYLCAPRTCTPVVGDYAVYSNRDHITATYVHALTTSIAAAIGLRGVS